MNKICHTIILLLLSGCASQVPPAISTPPERPVRLAEARSAADQFVGTEVRWGGVIAKVDNLAALTQVEVVSRELKQNGKPRPESNSMGRFIASFTGFVDPVVYGPGNLLTVTGTLSGQTTRKIGEYSYEYPVVNVTAHYLWPEESEPLPYDYPYPPPWYYDPWWPYYYRPHHPPYYW